MSLWPRRMSSNQHPCVQDIRVCEPPKPQPTLTGGLPNDPAIVQHSTPGGPVSSKAPSYGAVGSGPPQASPEGEHPARSQGSSPSEMRRSPATEAKLQDRQNNRWGGRRWGGELCCI